MKSMKHIGVSIFLALSIFCTVWYSSCSKDACMGVTCLNFGTCGGGICQCDSGTGGNNCDVVYRNLYANVYSGTASFSFSTSDSVDKNHTDTSNTLTFSYGADTMFDNMQVIWNDSSSKVTFPIALSNNTASGSDFTITGPIVAGNYSYTGTGSISSTAASMTLMQYPTAGGPAVIIKLSNFTQ